jgi:hypothetical protein
MNAVTAAVTVLVVTSDEQVTTGYDDEDVP